jgi:molybdopterin molybdotransferase
MFSVMNDSQAVLTPEQAQQLVLARINVLGAERVSLLDALDRLLARDEKATYDNPPHDNSAMDGYAVRFDDIAGASADKPVSLEVIEEIPAGTIGKKQVGPGQASRVMTGAPIPAGIDTVIKVEDTKSGGKTSVDIMACEEKGTHIRRRGEDMRTGEVLMPSGTRLSAGEVGVLASLQRTFVPVYRRPTIAILSTGDELVEIDEPLEPGKIVNSNTASLAAMVMAHGGVPVMLPTAPDIEDEIRRTIETGLGCDFILSSGGVSVGDFDFVKKVLDDMEAEQVLWRVAMKPGKPLFFCLLRGRPFFGLPGNPVSSLMSFLQFVRPAVRKASGYAEGQWLLPTARARMRHLVKNHGDRREYQRARLDWDGDQLMADTAYRAQGSHILTSMLGANGVVVLEPGQRAEAGDEVGVQIIGDVFQAR